MRMERRDLVKLLVGTVGGLIGTPSILATAARSQPPPTSPPSTPASVLEFQPRARQRLSRMAYDYLSQGAADEITLRRNREAFDAIRLKPRVLVDVSRLDTRLELFGQQFDFPILLAPTGGQRLMHPGAEPETARGAHAAGATMVVSTGSAGRIQEIARAAPVRLWFQLYVQRDRGVTRDLVQGAEAAGSRVLCITVDTPVVPMRDREKRWGMQSSYAGQPTDPTRQGAIYTNALDPTVTWETIAWVRSFAKTPIMLKGILAPEDARRAADEGLGGVIVSNHGGRNLDTTPATIEALPAVASAVDGRITVMLDGGIRRGTDVLK